jgi:uncharacterized membrane protein
MYRWNLDIFVAGATGLLGGAAYALHVPEALQVIFGIALFFAPGYLWSEAILSQRLTGLERVITTAGLSLILPILGGFLFYGLHIPLFRSAWVGMLVVLTLLGVVAVSIVRLREQPAEAPSKPRPDQPPKQRKLPVLNAFIYGIAGVIALGSVAFSVNRAEAEKYPGYTMLGMTTLKGDAAKASLDVTNHQGVTEHYRLKLLDKGKVTSTWNLKLADGQTWATTVAYTEKQNYSIVANLYLLPDTSKPYRTVDNGQ